MPLVDAIVTLCGRGESFEKSIVTFPAFAASDVVLYANRPLGLAASFSAPAVVSACVGVEEALGVDPVPAELALLELPQLLQPTSAASASRTLAVKSRRMQQLW